MKVLWNCWSPKQLATHLVKHSFLNCCLKFLSKDIVDSIARVGLVGFGELCWSKVHLQQQNK